MLHDKTANTIYQELREKLDSEIVHMPFAVIRALSGVLSERMGSIYAANHSLRGAVIPAILDHIDER